MISFADESNIASINMHIKAGFEILQNSGYGKSRYSWDGAVVFAKTVERNSELESE